MRGLKVAVVVVVVVVVVVEGVIAAVFPGCALALARGHLPTFYCSASAARACDRRAASVRSCGGKTLRP